MQKEKKKCVDYCFGSHFILTKKTVTSVTSTETMKKMGISISDLNEWNDLLTKFLFKQIFKIQIVCCSDLKKRLLTVGFGYQF